MSLLDLIGYVNEVLKVCWSGALAGFIFCAIAEMVRGKEYTPAIMSIGFLVLAGGILSLAQLVILTSVGLLVGIWAWTFLVLPAGFILTAFGAICANNPRRVGEFLCNHSPFMVITGLLMVFPYSVISLSHQAWHYYFA